MPEPQSAMINAIFADEQDRVYTAGYLADPVDEKDSYIARYAQGEAKYFITKSTGDEQIVLVSSMTEPMVSLVTISGTTNPANNIAISFTISTYPAGAEGQILTKSSETTNQQGLADVQLRLGDIPAEYGVTAICPQCVPESSSVTFTCCGKLPNDDFKQFDDRWATYPYNTQTRTYTKTIKQVGCALTNLATLINYYAVTFPELNISTTDPKELNDILLNKTSPRGFDSNHNIRFELVESTNISNGRIDYINESPYTVSRYTIPRLRNLIDNDLKEKLPVIATVTRKKGKEEWQHFAIIIGKCGNKYIISDPGNLIGKFLVPEDIVTLPDGSTVGPLKDIRRFRRK